jgi:predicted TIM-barrel fold metal-dependent hydrolase
MPVNHSRREFAKACAWVGTGAVLARMNWPSRSLEHLWNARAEAQEAQGQVLPPEATNGPWRNLRAVKEKKVIDFHTHTYETPVQGTNYKEEGHMHEIDQWKDYTEDLIASMNRYGVAQACITPAFVPEEVVAETSFKAYPARFVRMTSAFTRHTKTEKEVSPTEVAQIYKGQFDQGAKGVGETGYMLGVRGNYTVKDLKPVIDVILQYDVPVLTHTGWGVSGQRVGQNYIGAERWAENFGLLLSTYPDLKVVLGHMGGRLAIPDGYEALRLAYSFDNAYCEMSKSPVAVVTEAVKGLGAERVLFGSDWNRPQGKMYGPLNQHFVFQQWYNLNTIANAEITEDQRDWVLSKSARKLLKLDAT